VVPSGLLGISDAWARGERTGGLTPGLRSLLQAAGFELTHYEIVPQEAAQIRRVLRLWVDREGLSLILTVGAAGLAPRDLAPEATRELLTREIPGLAELLRMGLRLPLFRGAAGIRGQSLILNLPEDAETALRLVLGPLKSALKELQG
jgi:molybdopterin adenylyltransferase